jgi:hypothetical protein
MVSKSATADFDLARLEGWPQAAACVAILRDAVLRTAPLDEVEKRIHTL